MSAVSSTHKSFTRDEMGALLARAAARVVERCRTEWCDPPPPERFVFALSPPKGDAPPGVVELPAAVEQLVRPDGSFREWVNLTPVGTAGGATVIELAYPESFTHTLLEGELAFPFEPLLLFGPPLPSDWREGDPIPRLALPPFERA